MAPQPIDGRALRKSHPAPSAGNRITYLEKSGYGDGAGLRIQAYRADSPMWSAAPALRAAAVHNLGDDKRHPP